MWSKLDDALIDHPKLFAAGAQLGKNGTAQALALYTVGLLWTNRHLTDGKLPLATVQSWRHVDAPLKVAAALVKANLWEQNGNGFFIHDFFDFNYSAAETRDYRAKLSEARSEAGRNGGQRSAEVRRERAKQTGKQS